VFVLVSAAFGAAPFGQYLVAADLDVGILFVVALAGALSIALVGSPSLAAGLRAAARAALCAAPAAIATACVVVMTGSIRLREIIGAQGAMPWEWYAFRSPVAFGLFVLYFAAALGPAVAPRQGELPTGDLPADGPRDAPARPLLALADAAHVLVLSSVAAALFLGGWRLPGLSLGQLEAAPAFELLASAVFLAKAWTVAGLLVWARAALPELGPGDVTRLFWRWLLPISCVLFALTSGWVAYRPGELAERALAAGTFALVCLVAARFVLRVRFHARTVDDAHLNPFL
jgi:NADH-quinone oxidoreductase subunit H